MNEHITTVKVTKEEKIFLAESRDMEDSLEFQCPKDTGEKGTEPNNVETGCISNKVANVVPGVGTLPDGEITANADVTAGGNVETLLPLVGQSKWFFETLDGGVGKVGIKWYARINGITFASQTLGEMQEFTLNYTLEGDDFYFVSESGKEYPLSGGDVYTPPASGQASAKVSIKKEA